MGNQYAIRLGAGAGWISFAGIVAALIAAPMILAGQPPTIATDPTTVTAYFRHPELAVIYGFVAPIVGAVAIVVFGIGLREAMRRAENDRVRAFADIGLLLLIVSVPLYLISAGLAVTLVHAADGDPGIFATLFRLYEVVYDGTADVVEGAWIGAFAIAMMGSAFPRWLGWLGVALGLSRWVKALIPLGVPVDAILLPSGVLFVVWFLAVVVALTAAARRPAPVPVQAAASA
jgi:hypothetical protein